MHWIQELVHNQLELSIHNHDNHGFFHWQHQLLLDSPNNFLVHQWNVLLGCKMLKLQYY